MCSSALSSSDCTVIRVVGCVLFLSSTAGRHPSTRPATLEVTSRRTDPSPGRGALCPGRGVLCPGTGALAGWWVGPGRGPGSALTAVSCARGRGVAGPTPRVPAPASTGPLPPPTVHTLLTVSQHFTVALMAFTPGLPSSFLPLFRRTVLFKLIL